MTVNHLELLFYPTLIQMPLLNFLSQVSGPAVAPLFIYLSSEGYFYTRNKKRYMGSLLLGFWSVSIMKFVLINLLNLDSDYENLLFMNIFGGIFQAVLAMYLYDLIVTEFKRKQWAKLIGCIIILIGLLTAMFWMSLLKNPQLINIGMNILPVVVEGAPVLPLLGLLFYIFRKNKIMILLIATLFVLPNSLSDILTNGFSGGIWPALFLPILIYFYNGKRGFGPNKYFFYVYYPLHISLFIIINHFFIN
ncbi:hypothetical protein A5881_003855 [Enterococcus termitis]